MFPSPFPPSVGYAILRLGEGAAVPAAADRRERGRLLHQLGRTAAQRALQQIGCSSSEPIPRGPAGEPLWPSGAAGSITHTGEWACAAASLNARAIGLDLEQLTRSVSFDIARRVCTSEEYRTLRGLGEERARDLWLKRIFSAKECIYKALYPLCGSKFWFHDVQTEYQPEQTALIHAELQTTLSPELPAGFRFNVGLCENDTHVLSWMHLAR